MRKKRGFIDIQNMKPRFTFIFPAHGKIHAWAGRKNTPAEKGNYKSILGEMGVS